MGISLDRALDLRDRMKIVVLDTFSMARSYKASHAEILDLLGERVYDTPQYAQLPRWARAYLQGRTDAEFDRMYDLLEWRVFWREELVLSSAVLDGTWNECSPELGRHVYKTDPSKIY